MRIPRERDRGRRPLRQTAITIATGASLIPVAAHGADAPPIVSISARAPADHTAVPAARKSLGFIVESDGFVLTTYRNVVSPEDGRLLSKIEIELRSRPGPRYDATIVGVEPTLDLAILKLDTDQTFEAADIKTNSGFSVGQEIYAPNQIDGNKTALGRLTGLNSKECYQETLTAAMYRAEIRLPDRAAGAPVYGKNGEIVAIHTAYDPPDAEGHVDDEDEIHILPIFLAFNIYDAIKEKKSFLSPWTGFSVRGLAREESAGFPTADGYRGAVVIEAVVPGSPAARMGIEAGDLLLQLGHNRVESVADFQKWLYLYGVGHEVDLVILRDGRDLMTTRYEIEARPANVRPR